MKRTQLIELYMNIRKTKVSFVAIVMFVALGIAIFLGAGWSGIAIKKSVFNDVEKYNFNNAKISFPLGFSDNDLDCIKQLDGVDDIEGAYVSNEFFFHDGFKYQARVASITERINTLSVRDGELPNKQGEIAVEKVCATKNGIKVGDSITFVHNDKGDAYFLKAVMEEDTELLENSESPDGMKYLKDDTFVVTALVEDMVYLAASPATYGVDIISNAPISCLMYVSKESFDEDAFDGYVEAYVGSKYFDGIQSAGDEYQDAYDRLSKELDSVVGDIANAKNSQLQKHIDNIKSSAEDKLDEGKLKIDDAIKQIKDGEEMIASSEIMLADGKDELDNTKRELEVKQAQLYDGLVELETVKLQLEDEKEQYAAKMQEYNDASDRYTRFNNAYLELKRSYDVAINDYLKIKGEYSSLESIEQREEYLRGLYYNTQIGELLNEYGVTVEVLENCASMSIDELYFLIDDVIERAEEESVRLEAQLEYAKQELAKAEELKLEVEAKLAQAESQIAEGEALLAYGQEMIDDAWQQVAEGERLLKDKESELIEGKAKLEEARNKYADALKEYDSNKQKYEERKEKLADVAFVNAVVSSGDMNVRSVDVLVDVLEKLKYNMAALFVIFGLLICYSCISRMVSEQTVQVGTKKAIGLRQREITIGYLCYSSLAAIIGVCVGIAIARFVVEPVMVTSIQNSYVYDEKLYSMDFSNGGWLIFVELALVVLTTFFACRSILKRNAILLLADAKEVSGKVRFYEKWKLWDKLSLFNKTIVNNCFNDKKRVFSTVVGIAGCCALVVCSITLRNSVLNSFDRQYEAIYNFDQVIYFDKDDEESKDRIKAIVRQNGLDYSETCNTLGGVRGKNGSLEISFIFVGMDDNFNNIINVMPTDNVKGERIRGAWMNFANYNANGNPPGSTIEFEDVIKGKVKIDVCGYFEYYLTRNQLIMDADYYKEVYGSKPVSNSLLVKVGNADIRSITAELNEIPGFICVDNHYDSSFSAFETFSNIATILVAVYLVLSFVMAVLVLLVLLTMFVNEKKRELIVLMINGYPINDTKRYIYSDTIVMTVIGLIVGTVIGHFIGILSVGSFESSMTIFVKSFNYTAAIVGVVVCVGLTFVMTIIALKRIDKFKLNDINKM